VRGKLNLMGGKKIPQSHQEHEGKILSFYNKSLIFFKITIQGFEPCDE